jgi:drug/metabolite transporter (DMT)-like permease
MSLNPTSVIAYSRLKRRQFKQKARSGSLAYFALFLTSFVWGTTWVASKIGIQGIHPLFFSAIRQTLGGTCFLLFFLVTGKAVLPSPRQWGQLIVLAFLLFVTSNGLTTWGIKYISSGLGAILGATFPLIVALIDLVTGHHKKPSPLALLGLILGFAGVAVIFYDHLADFANPDFRFGIILSFIAACTTWRVLAYMVILGSVITFGAMLYTLQHMPTTIASLYAYFNPMVAVVAGHFILNEPWSLVLLIGAMVTILGVFLVNFAYRKSMD